MKTAEATIKVAVVMIPLVPVLVLHRLPVTNRLDRSLQISRLVGQIAQTKPLPSHPLAAMSVVPARNALLTAHRRTRGATPMILSRRTSVR